MADPRNADGTVQEEEELSTYQRLLRKQEENKRATQFVVQAAERRKEIQQAEEAMQAQRRNLLLDTGTGTARGISGAFAEAFDTLSEIDEWSYRNLGSFDLNPFDGGFGYVAPSKNRAFEEQGGKIVSPFRVPEAGWENIKHLFPEPDRIPGKILEPMSQFIVGFVAGGSVLKGAKVLQGTSTLARFGNATVAGAAADFTVFDAHEQRLSNLIESYPDLQNPVTGWLAAKTEEETTVFEEKIKQVIEGAAMGAILEPFMLGLRALKRAAFAKEVSEAIEEVDNMGLKFEKIADEADKVEAKLDDVADDLQIEDFTDAKLADLEVDRNSILITKPRAELRPEGEDLGDVVLGPDEAAKIEGMVRGGETLQVVNAAVEPALQGKGVGRQLYDRLIAIADERGLRFTSDTSVSEKAAALWHRLERDGHEIIDRTKTGEAELIDGQWQTSGGRPVFERVRGPEAAEKIAKTVDDGLQGKRDMQHDIVVAMRDALEERRATGQATKTAERNLQRAENRLKKMDAAEPRGPFRDF